MSPASSDSDLPPAPADILIIEDETSVRELLRMGLERRGYRVRAFQNGEEGIAAVHAKTPDLIICDVMMPGDDGFAVCQKIRQAGIKSPFLFLTGKKQTESMVMGLQMGADDYLVKPFDLRELDARIQVLLRRRPA